MKSWRLLALLAALVLSSCASTRVLRDFHSDGCSLFPDGDAADRGRWADCCKDHDRVYWRGGSARQRQTADAGLRQCVLARSQRPVLAAGMHAGVRIGGLPWWPTPFRWAYGWGYGRGYTPLTAAESQQADDLLDAYRRRFPEPSCVPP